MPRIYQVMVYPVRGQKVVINLCNTEEQFKTFTVRQLKEKISQRVSENADHLRLIFNNKPLDGDSTPLCDYGIRHMSFIDMVVKVPGGASFPEKGDGGIGDKDKNRSMEKLAEF